MSKNLNRLRCRAYNSAGAMEFRNHYKNGVNLQNLSSAGETIML
jgi:hypothetical protein